MKTIGESAFISIMGREKVPAKVDTGADTSSIWASKIKISRDGVLSFALFGPGSKYYTGKVLKRTDFKVAVVRSATGHEQIRYRTTIKMVIQGKKMRILFNLSDRSRNNFPVLIGKRTIRGKFIVDPTIRPIRFPKIATTKKLKKDLAKNPYKFHKKYVKNSKRKKK